VSVFGSFVSPFRAAGDAFFAGVATAYADAIRGRLDQYADAGSVARLEQHHGIRFKSGRPCMEWMPEMGYLNTLLRPEARNDPQLALAQYCLCAIEFGSRCDIEFATAPGSLLHFRGHRFSTGNSTRLQFDGGRFCVTADGAAHYLQFDGRAWKEYPEDTLCRSDDISQGIIFVSGRQANPELLDPADPVLPDELFPSAIDGFSRALALIKDLSPEYWRWCIRVLRHVNFIAADVDFTRSRSTPGWPGAIVISHPAPDLQHAEDIVHECTHQYYYMASMMTSIRRRRNDQEMYYSALVGQPRPIERILLAYHATANIMLFLEKAADSSLEFAGVALARMRRIAPICWHLLETLRANAGALTENANILWQESVAPVAAVFESRELPT
jgi:HEXXH motif-containing protein